MTLIITEVIVVSMARDYNLRVYPSKGSLQSECIRIENLIINFDLSIPLHGVTSIFDISAIPELGYEIRLNCEDNKTLRHQLGKILEDYAYRLVFLKSNARQTVTT